LNYVTRTIASLNVIGTLSQVPDKVLEPGVTLRVHDISPSVEVKVTWNGAVVVSEVPLIAVAS